MQQKRNGQTGTRPSGYGATALVLHWLIAALLVAQFIVAWRMPEIGHDTAIEPLITRHFTLGALVFFIMTFRLGWRLRHPVALDTPGLARWEIRSAHATHRLFYLILLLGPILGWAAASAHGLPIRLFDAIPLPAIAARDAGWALTAGTLHALMMWALLALIALHASAAFYHHVVRHDNVLMRMLRTRKS